jgi:hypothetical protein
VLNAHVRLDRPLGKVPRYGLYLSVEQKDLNVPQIEVSEEQILNSLERLSPKGRREAVLRLVAGASALDKAVDAFQPRLIELATQRGLVWARLSDEERERLVDDILHE